MRIIHCTQKLQKEINEEIIKVDESQLDKSGIGNWYANIFRIDRRKCILFTHELSLYTFLVPGVKKKELTNIKNEFCTNLKLNLLHEGIDNYIINKILSEYDEIVFCKTMNRSVLGSMNDFRYGYEVHIYSEPPNSFKTILSLNKKLNMTPMAAIKYAYPIEKFKEILNKLYKLH